MNPEFSFIILTLNEENHLPRLLASIAGLKAHTYVLDSGSTDATLDICRAHQVTFAIHPFENHPKQWHHALSCFPIQTPWVVCLDADQQVSAALYQRLSDFKHHDHQQLSGIYFNRKNIFKGHWIKHGGFFPKYMLKMFRHGAGYSDLNENMDHRFIAKGLTLIWKDGLLIEENLKENEISFWLDKHNRYSDLVATEEIERMQHLRSQTLKPAYFGTPDQRTAWLKHLWWQLPLMIRPLLYFLYRLLVQRGFLDGKTGMRYHFLHAYWFRLIIDIKIEEKLNGMKGQAFYQEREKNQQVRRFIFAFLFYAALFYSFNLAFIGLSSPGGIYIGFLDKHVNYISAWRTVTIDSTAALLRMLNYESTVGQYGLHVTGKAGFRLVYSCLGYGLLSLFAAFIVSFPNSLKTKFRYLLTGVILFQGLNTCRLVMVSLFWTPTPTFMKQYAHELFNGMIYILMMVMMWLYLHKRKENA